MTFHRWVLHDGVLDYLRLGWMALPTLNGTHHGNWSAHCIWLCQCRPVEPGYALPSPMRAIERGER